MRRIISSQMTRVRVYRRGEQDIEIDFYIPGRCDRYDPRQSFLMSDATARALLDALREAYKDG